MFRPAFTATCDMCGEITMWFKANRAVQADGRTVVAKGFKCADCETFEEKVLDTRGKVQSRSA